MRSMLLVPLAAAGVSLLGVNAASALEIGPISVPVPVPPASVPPLPTVGPVVVEAPGVAPDLGVTATVSPTAEVAIDVKTPSAIGPVEVPVPSQSVHVGIGHDGVNVAAPTIDRPSTPSLPTSYLAPELSAVPSARAATPATLREMPGGVPGGVSAGADAKRAPRTTADPVGPSSNVVVGDASSAVSASLSHAAHGPEWNLWREVARARTLLLVALLLIVLVARWALGGFLRDALLRARVVNPV